MMKPVKEIGQGLVEYALTLVLVAIVMMAVMSLLAGPHAMFVQAIEDGSIVVNGTKIALGESGHPQSVGSDIHVVNQLLGPSSGLASYPQKYSVTGCENLYIWETGSVYAATPVNEDVALLIDIWVPARSGGYVQVCVPDGLSDVPVYLWYKQVDP